MLSSSSFESAIVSSSSVEEKNPAVSSTAGAGALTCEIMFPDFISERSFLSEAISSLREESSLTI